MNLLYAHYIIFVCLCFLRSRFHSIRSGQWIPTFDEQTSVKDSRDCLFVRYLYENMQWAFIQLVWACLRWIFDFKLSHDIFGFSQQAVSFGLGVPYLSPLGPWIQFSWTLV
jgi:hypothetical protein